MLLPFAQALAALALSAVAHAQPLSEPHPKVAQLQGLAPHLAAFAGSPENFRSLAAGLTLGEPIHLASVDIHGVGQTVSFHAGIALAPDEAARLLEAARQALIVHGIAQPSARELAVAVVGGTLVTPLSSVRLPGVLGGRPVSVRVHSRAGPPPPSHALRAALMEGRFTGERMSAFEANTALALARVLLAQHGIFAPTRRELELALLGGTMAGPTGTVVPVQGVLQGPPRHTSDSPYFGTSHSHVLGTSHSPVVGTSRMPPVTIPGPRAGAPVPGAAALPPRAAGVVPVAPAIQPRFGVAR